MHTQSDVVIKAIEVAIVESHYEGKNFVIYLLSLALIAAKEDRKDQPSACKTTRP